MCECSRCPGSTWFSDVWEPEVWFENKEPIATTQMMILIKFYKKRYSPDLVKNKSISSFISKVVFLFASNLGCQWRVCALVLSLYHLVREKPTEEGQTSPLNSTADWFKPWHMHMHTQKRKNLDTLTELAVRVEWRRGTVKWHTRSLYLLTVARKGSFAPESTSLFLDFLLLASSQPFNIF